MTHESKFYTEGGPKITEFRVRFTDLTTLDAGHKRDPLPIDV